MENYMLLLFVEHMRKQIIFDSFLLKTMFSSLLLFVPLPTHIKLDVDSTEKEILEGAANLLAKSQVQSIWVEVDGVLERERNQGIINALSYHVIEFFIR